MEGKDATPKEKQASPAQKKQITTNRVNAKIAAMREEMEARKKDRFSGLPKNLEAFAKWTGEGHEDRLYEIPVQTLKSRKDLLPSVWTEIDKRKAPSKENAKKDSRIKELEKQLKGLASENHQLHLTVEEMKSDLNIKNNKIEKLEMERGSSISNVVDISHQND